MAYELQDLSVPVRFAIHDRDSKFTSGFDAVLESEGVEVIRTPYRAPRANSHCERSIGSARREFFDFMIVIGERHLRLLLERWLDHYNRVDPTWRSISLHPIQGQRRRPVRSCASESCSASPPSIHERRNSARHRPPGLVASSDHLPALYNPQTLIQSAIAGLCAHHTRFLPIRLLMEPASEFY